jgi:hypothetical protein
MYRRHTPYQDRQDCQERNAKTGIPDRAVKAGLPEQDCQNRTVNTRLSEQDIQNKTAKRNSEDRTARS